VTAEPGFTLDADLALAHELADLADEIATRHFARALEPRRKSDGTPVTAADVEIERALCEHIVRARPDDAILGEEFGAQRGGPRRWILDPIDGTAHFVAGRTDWGTHIALERDGELGVGVITRPALRQRWWAARGRGATRSQRGRPDERLSVSEVRELRDSRVSVWAEHAEPRWERLAARANRVESDLDDILRLAAGELEAVIDVSGRPWDHAPAVILVEEAGGRFRDRTGGRRLDLGEGRYTNGRIDRQLDEVLDA